MYEGFTTDYLRNEMLKSLDSSITKIEGSFASDVLSAMAYRLSELWEEMQALYGLMFFEGLYG